MDIIVFLLIKVSASIICIVLKIIQFFICGNTIKEAVMLWQHLAGDMRLAGEVVDVLLEIINHEHDTSINQSQLVTQSHMLGSASALSIMLETKKLEELARLELGRLVSSLVMMFSRGIGHHFTRGSVTSLTKTDVSRMVTNPVSVSVSGT